MRLYSKISLTIAVTVLVATGAGAAAVGLAFVPQYRALDRDAATTNAGRVYETLQSELATASTYTADWGHWDEAFEFAKTLDPAFIANNLKQEDLQTIQVDEFAIADFDRTLKFELRADRTGQAGPVPLKGLKAVPPQYWASLANTTGREVIGGYVATGVGPAIVMMTAVTDSNGAGPSPGVLILVRLVDQEFLAAVQEKTRLHFTLTPATTLDGARQSAQGAQQTDGAVTLVEGKDEIEAKFAIKGVSGAPSFSVSVLTPTRYEQIAVRTIWLILGLLFAIGAIVITVLAAFMRRAVTGPLEAIIHHTEAISSSGNLDRTLGLKRRDEIGTLADAFDRMIGELREARLLLQEQSFVSGMANSAAEMLHNIRNSLSPIEAAIWKGRDALREVKTDRLGEAGAALAHQDTDPARRSKLAEYVNARANDIGDRVRNAETEFETIGGFTKQIEHFLAHHEELSRGVRLMEPVRLADVVKAVAKLTQSQKPPIELFLSPALQSAPPVYAQRVVLLQVLGNLIVNAMQSIQRAGVSGGRIVIDAASSDAQVELTIADNGEGVAPERKGLLFTRGFTTRPGEGSGLGLHYCATSVSAMNGTIAVASEGPGRGATFKISLPRAKSEEQAA